MAKLLLKKLIVINQLEELSKEINFTDGLNIIFGHNKTGKSSLIKSIFYTLGCQIKMEESWLNMINYFILYFSYDDEYCIVRNGKSLRLVRINDGRTQLIVDTTSFTEFSKEFMSILGVSMVCMNSRTNSEMTATPPLVFRFQYIDQDSGWSKIGESFSNMQYITNWRDESTKYIVGFTDERYFKLKNEIAGLKYESNNLINKKNNYGELIGSLENFILPADDEVKDFEKPLNVKHSLSDNLLNELEVLKNQKLVINKELNRLSNQRYRMNMELQHIMKNASELDADYDYAMGLDETVQCPFCGTNFENGITERLEIAKDMSEANELLQAYRKDIALYDNEIETKNNSLRHINRKIFSLESKVERISHDFNVLDEYREEGKFQLLKQAHKEREMLEDAITKKNCTIDLKSRSIDALTSSTTRRSIRDEISSQIAKTYTSLNLTNVKVKTRNFVQQIKQTGSDTPRIIYGYHIALFKYNLEREEGIFNFLVIDTPNQQGQDEENLSNIDVILDDLKDSGGQVIIGTERETGFEDLDDVNTVLLTKKRACLSSEKYSQHLEILSSLLMNKENSSV